MRERRNILDSKMASHGLFTHVSSLAEFPFVLFLFLPNNSCVVIATKKKEIATRQWGTVSVMKFVWVCHGNEVSGFLLLCFHLSSYCIHGSIKAVMETRWEEYKRRWKERSVSEVSIRDHKWKEALSHFKEETSSQQSAPTEIHLTFNMKHTRQHNKI